MSKAYEKAKDDVTDVKALLQLNEKFSQTMSLRRANQTESFQHLSHVGSTELVAHPSPERLDPQLTVHDPLGPMKTKDRPKVATRIRSGIENSTENRRKRLCGYCGKQGHISTGCAKRRMAMHHIRGDEE